MRVFARVRSFVLIGVAIAAGCEFDKGDQVCTPDSNYNDLTDQCPYGRPGGPDLPLGGGSGGGAAICTITETCTMPAPTWTDVYTILTTYDGMGGCAHTGCHDTTTHAQGLAIPTGDPATAYANFMAYQGVKGVTEKYVDPTDPKHTIFVCTLQPMPPAMMLQMPEDTTSIKAEQLQTLIDWAACGEQDTMGTAASTGGGATTSGGGTGGAGGAGGGVGGGGAGGV